MALVANDWSIDQATKNIRYIGDGHTGASPSYATVLEFHRWLQDLADDPTFSGDDELAISYLNPSERSTDNIVTLVNGYNIDDTAAEHLYDGSIIQNNGDEIYDGVVNYGNADVQIQIIQDGAVLASDWWNQGGGGLNADAANGISHRFMLKVRTGGADIDGRRLIGICRRFGYTYKEFKINGTARGNNVLALTDTTDLNNQTAESTVSGWTGISNLTEGYKLMDVDNDGTNEAYYSEWDRGAHSINDLYEYFKYLTRDGSTSTLYGLSGELFRGITHEVAYTSLAGGNFTEASSVSWTGGTGQILADNGTDTIWIQLLTGIAPSSGDTLTQGGVTATVGTVTERDVSTPAIGTSTGSSIIGAYGLGIQAVDLSASDKVFDLTNTQISPPNYVQNTVSGVTSGEDYVLVAPWDGSTTDPEGNPAINKSQLGLATALTTDNITSVKVSTTIPSDTPSSGHIRVVDDNGKDRKLHYSSWSGDTFTIDTTDGNEDFAAVNASAGNNVYITYIDELATASSVSFTSVQSGTRNLVVVVRDGGSTPIKQFISSWSQTSSPSTISVIRTSDE